jgi:hypothetical protein
MIVGNIDENTVGFEDGVELGRFVVVVVAGCVVGDE